MGICFVENLCKEFYRDQGSKRKYGGQFTGLKGRNQRIIEQILSRKLIEKILSFLSFNRGHDLVPLAQSLILLTVETTQISPLFILMLEFWP